MYDTLLDEADRQGVFTYEDQMKGRLHGLYCDNVICIDKRLATFIEKICILAEEIGHYHTSFGNILDKHSLVSKKQERRAREWAYERLLPLSVFIKAYKEGVRNRFELAEYTGVTEIFLDDAINRYYDKYGVFKDEGDYIVYFSPLDILEKFGNSSHKAFL